MFPAETIRSAPACSHGIFYPHMRHSTFFRKVQQLHEILIKSWGVGGEGESGGDCLGASWAVKEGDGSACTATVACCLLWCLWRLFYRSCRSTAADALLLQQCHGHRALALKWTRSCTQWLAYELLSLMLYRWLVTQRPLPHCWKPAKQQALLPLALARKSRLLRGWRGRIAGACRARPPVAPYCWCWERLSAN